MKLKDLVNALFSYDGPQDDQGFLLQETQRERQIGQDTPHSQEKNSVRPKQQERKIKKPIKVNEYGTLPKRPEQWKVYTNLAKNRECIEYLFYLPLNKDVVIREFSIPTQPPVNAFLVYIDGTVDTPTVRNFILQPLMLLTCLDPNPQKRADTCEKVLKNLLPSDKVKKLTKFMDLVGEITGGSTVIFFEGCSYCISAETKGFQFRNVEAPKTEQVVQGPQEAFVENLRSNTSLLRRIIRSKDLITEFVKVGLRNDENVAIMYLKDLANPDLIKEIKRRLSLIKTDFVSEAGTLEEFIEDHPFSMVPQIVKTERPDRVAFMLAEGRAAIIVDNSPFVIIVPVTIFDFLHSPEDHYVRFPYGLCLRLIRVTAVFLTMLLPAFYVAIATFHQEMIPTDLILSIVAAKERVPFPTIVEIMLMELSFELIREAGVRVPGIIGPTLGIVGTLILGQAAVAATIVSPISIIIVAVTGLASYTIPNYSASFGFRIIRFVFLLLAATQGFFGISTGLFILLTMLMSMHSFGVPFFSPIAPRTAPGQDVIARLPIWMQDSRPDYLQSLDITRQPKVSRKWKK